MAEKSTQPVILFVLMATTTARLSDSRRQLNDYKYSNTEDTTFLQDFVLGVVSFLGICILICIGQLIGWVYEKITEKIKKYFRRRDMRHK